MDACDGSECVSIRLCVCVLMRSNICICNYACTPTKTKAYVCCMLYALYVLRSIGMQVCVCLCLYVCVCVFVCVCVYMLEYL